ncbi:MAG TPA: hypothetical protein DDZ89_13020 [Clostridiales bacterium]|nr:hypothetical protein [Clostridiales bacterium]
MQNPLVITIIAIISSSLLIAYIRRVTKDRCLKAFQNDHVTLLLSDQREINGKLVVESTGLEVIYEIQKVEDLPLADGTPPSPEMHHASFILFKNEFSLLTAILRRHNNLTEEGQKKRKKEIKAAYHPHFFRKLGRRIRNFFSTIKDSLLEIINLLSGQLEAANPNSILTSQKAQKTKVEKEMISQITYSYDALLEKYIGNVVICEFNMNGTKSKISGILKDYTAAYLEILDVQIKTSKDPIYNTADLIVPRTLAIVRHLGEDTKKLSLFKKDFNIQQYKKFLRKRKNETLNQ